MGAAYFINMAVETASFQDVKPGDLIISKYPDGRDHSQAVVIGLPTEASVSGGYLGLNQSTIAPGIMCYRRFPDRKLGPSISGHFLTLNSEGHFLTLNENHWKNGASGDYVPREQDELSRKLSRQLLELARADLTRPVYKSKPLEDLGLNSRNAEQVLNTIEDLLKVQ